MVFLVCPSCVRYRPLIEFNFWLLGARRWPPIAWWNEDTGERRAKAVYVGNLSSRKSDQVSRVFGGSSRRVCVETVRRNSTKLVEYKILHKIVCKILHSRPNMAILMISLATSPTSTSQPNTGWLSVTNRSSRTQTKYFRSQMGTVGPYPRMLHFAS